MAPASAKPGAVGERNSRASPYGEVAYASPGFRLRAFALRRDKAARRAEPRVRNKRYSNPAEWRGGIKGGLMRKFLFFVHCIITKSA